MNRTLAALLGTLAVITGCSTGPLAGSPAAASPSTPNEPQASTPSAPPSPSPAATATPFPYSEGHVAIEAGTYHIRSSSWSVADFTVTFPDGWSVQYGHVYHTVPDTAGELEFYAVVVDAIYADACEGSSGELLEVGPSVDDLAAALLQQPGPEASGPINTTLGGYPAVRIDLKVPQGSDLEACSMGGAGLQIWYSRPADKYFVLLADGTASAYILDVEGERQVFMTQVRSATTDDHVAELQAVIDSIEIEP
jgi:hypothetical protein